MNTSLPGILFGLLVGLVTGCAATPPAPPPVPLIPAWPTPGPISDETAEDPDGSIESNITVHAAGHEFQPLLGRAARAAALIHSSPTVPGDLYSTDFLKAVPAEKLTQIGQKFHDKYGAIQSLELVKSPVPNKGKFVARYAKGYSGPITVTVQKETPHAIIGLWLGSPIPDIATMKAVIAKLEELPGTVSFAVHKLDGNQFTPIAEHNSDKALAIGSGFKLYILGRLVQDIQRGQRRWNHVASLDQKHMSLPSGVLHKWPVGSPLTLHSLATLMISISDNTATDHLLFTLGRKQVEAMLAPMGNKAAARNIPFLSTREMFQLKESSDAKRVKNYLGMASANTRRVYLNQTLSKEDLPDLEKYDRDGPFHISDVEWFASANDLCRALAWLWRETAQQRTAPGRELLTVNRGLPISRKHFPFIGYKGGSEPGVLSLNYLLQRKDKTWFTLSATWNDEKSSLDDDQLTDLLVSATKVLALGGK